MKSTERSRVKRAPKRGNYDRDVIHSILDDHFICHIAFIEKNYPVVIPTIYGREGKNLYIHGASSSRLITALATGIEISLSVTLIDGIVLARSAFHHSMNYRSIVLFGKAEKINDPERKEFALKVISDHIVPGRWEEVRKPNQKELKATTILRIPLNEASAKIRTGPPVDEPEDYKLDIWAGVLPLSWQAGDPVSDPGLRSEIQPSKSVLEWLRKKPG